MDDDSQQFPDEKPERLGNNPPPSLAELIEAGFNESVKLKAGTHDMLLSWFNQAERCWLAVHEYGLKGKRGVGKRDTLEDFARQIGTTYAIATKLEKLWPFKEDVFKRCEVERNAAEIKEKPYEFPTWKTALNWCQPPKQPKDDEAPEPVDLPVTNDLAAELFAERSKVSALESREFELTGQLTTLQNENETLRHENEELEARLKAIHDGVATIQGRSTLQDQPPELLTHDESDDRADALVAKLNSDFDKWAASNPGWSHSGADSNGMDGEELSVCTIVYRAGVQVAFINYESSGYAHMEIEPEWTGKEPRDDQTLDADIWRAMEAWPVVEATATPADSGKGSQGGSKAISLPGCSYIYAPAGQAGEYSPLAANPYRGCGHGCAYCYVPNVLKMPRAKFDEGAVLRPDFFHNLRKEAAKYQAAGINEQVMISFTSDPYHLGDTMPTRETLEILRDHGLGFCTLSKGGTRALRDLDLFRPERDAYAATLTSLDDAFSLKWERKAALPGDRIATLKAFHAAGIFTWVSLEPTLDIESSLEIVRATHGFVDLFKVGRANYLKELTKTTDWKGYTERMIELMAQLGQRHYIKKDLQGYLPEGYSNPLRVAQHHEPVDAPNGSEPTATPPLTGKGSQGGSKPRQKAIRKGYLRCGQCGEVFARTKLNVHLVCDHGLSEQAARNMEMQTADADRKARAVRKPIKTK